jgi:crotonobetainyl-CoA:carnitine CoA-transferase CaiB-like acyl-CoA transferase
VDLLVDPHVVARADLPQVDDHVTGPMRQPAPYPRFSEFDSPLQGAPSLGEHNHEVWCDLLGLSEDDLESLISEGVI